MEVRYFAAGKTHIGIELGRGGKGGVPLAELLRVEKSPPPEDLAILAI